MKLNILKAVLVCMLAAFGWLLSSGISVGSDAVSDTGNCLLCHRYPSIGRYDEKGTKRVFYVNDKKFAASVHGKLACKNCHVGLDKIPHTDVKKVDCATKCHIKEPSTNQEFSHMTIGCTTRFRGCGAAATLYPMKPWPDVSAVTPRKIGPRISTPILPTACDGVEPIPKL